MGSAPGNQRAENRKTANRQTVPAREDLLAQLDRANQYVWLWLGTRLTAIMVLGALIEWDRVVMTPIVSVTAALVILGPFAMELMKIWGQKKKRLEDIKDQTRFGELDKHQLQNLYRETLQRLKLPDERLPVYVTSDKSLNAGALRLGKWFGGFNGIYLNRQLLHKLRGDEVQSIMGHELGHYYRFNLAGDRFRLVTLLLGTFVAIFVVQSIHLEGFLGFIVLSMTSYGFWLISGLAMLRHGNAIEHLCDDLGAQVHGIAPSVNALLKCGLDAEMRYMIQLELLARSAKNEMLTPGEVVAAVEKAIPYGKVAEVELYDSVQRELKDKAKSNQQASLSGFLKYLWDSDRDDEDDMEDLQQQARQINQLQRLDWELLLDDPDDVRFSQSQIDQLIHLMEASPGKVLFRLPDALGRTDGIHPPLATRILYLGKNRQSAVGVLEP